MTAMPIFEYHCEERGFRSEALIMGSALELNDCDSQSIKQACSMFGPAPRFWTDISKKRRIDID